MNSAGTGFVVFNTAMQANPFLFALHIHEQRGLCCHAAEIESQGLNCCKALECKGEIKLLTVLSREAASVEEYCHKRNATLQRKLSRVHATAPVAQFGYNVDRLMEHLF